MPDHPLPNGSIGRDTAGRFAKGNPGGPGNPRPRHTAALRQAFVEAVSDEDYLAVVTKLVELAKGGDLPAIRELLDRMLGKATAPIEVSDSTEATSVEQHRKKLAAYAAALGVSQEP